MNCDYIVVFLRVVSIQTFFKFKEYLLISHHQSEPVLDWVIVPVIAVAMLELRS